MPTDTNGELRFAVFISHIHNHAETDYDISNFSGQCERDLTVAVKAKPKNRGARRDRQWREQDHREHARVLKIYMEGT